MNKGFLLSILSLLVTLCFSSPSLAENEGLSFVKLPLTTYDQLIKKASEDEQGKISPPTAYALGKATVDLEVIEKNDQLFAKVGLEVSANVFEDTWTSIALLPSSTSLQEVQIDGKPSELFTKGGYLHWGTKLSGQHKIRLTYFIDVETSDFAYSLPIPLPQSAGATLKSRIPGNAQNISVLPCSGLQTTQRGSYTTLECSVPSSGGIHLSWRHQNRQGYSFSKAEYQGKVDEEGNSVWTSTFYVELEGAQRIELPLVPSTVTLLDIRVDDSSTNILVKEEKFHTTLEGKGTHKVELDFQVPVQRKKQRPELQLLTPKIPVSKFTLQLPGKKKLEVRPQASVRTTQSEQNTTAEVYLPMTSRVAFSWSEAIPEEREEEVQANASIYHWAYAQEGVMYLRAKGRYEFTRGKTNIIDFMLPSDVQINKITSKSGIIADWRVNTVPNNGQSKISIFLHRKIEGAFEFDVTYDKSIIGIKPAERIEIPLLTTVGTNRTKGMLALLSNKELTLEPVQEKEVIKVGENQLPAFIRNEIESTISHTYKYVVNNPSVQVLSKKPEKTQGKFDVMVNTLISLDDVSMKGSASLEVNIKSGSIEELTIEVPKGVNILNVSAPSLRSEEIETRDGKQEIKLQFTQEMEGQLRVEVSYEQIVNDKQDTLVVPTLGTQKAEVEQGRIAVEALSAVEIQALDTKQLSSVDSRQLPRQLVLKTSNPILMAYKYVRSTPAPQLTLKITRHQEIEVQAATIDSAQYRTLVIEDGLAITTAQFVVRNSRKQFLKIRLPQGSSIWAASVDNKPEKPALAKTKNKEEKTVLLKIINSSKGFPVTLIYQTPMEQMGSFGTLESILPTPDMIATRSTWDVFLPEQFSYGRVDSNMKVRASNAHVGAAEMRKNISLMQQQRQLSSQVNLEVPTAGVRYSFEKLYANQSDEEAYFSISYLTHAEGLGRGTLPLVTGLGILLLLVGTFLSQKSPQHKLGFVVATVGIISILATLAFFDTTHALLVLVGSGIATILLLVGLSFTQYKGSAPHLEASELLAADEPEESQNTED